MFSSGVVSAEYMLDHILVPLVDHTRSERRSVNVRHIMHSIPVVLGYIANITTISDSQQVIKISQINSAIQLLRSLKKTKESS